MYKMLTLVVMLVMLMTSVEGCSVEEKEEMAQYNLNAAAAAACLKSSDGSRATYFLPKDDAVSCEDQCGETKYSFWYAEVAIQTSLKEGESSFHRFCCCRYP